MRFTAVETAEIAEVTYRQIDYWCRAGCFGKQRANLGSGNRRVDFTREEILLIHVMGMLPEMNIQATKSRAENLLESGRVVLIHGPGLKTTIEYNAEDHEAFIDKRIQDRE